MNKYKSVVVDTLVASLLCASVQTVITYIFYVTNLQLTASNVPIQVLVVSFTISFAGIVAPLFAYNLYEI
jgi:hypothetical protein